jgi:hypothetical protein
MKAGIYSFYVLCSAASYMPSMFDFEPPSAVTGYELMILGSRVNVRLTADPGSGFEFFNSASE